MRPCMAAGSGIAPPSPPPPFIIFMAIFIISGLFIISLTIGLSAIAAMPGGSEGSAAGGGTVAEEELSICPVALDEAYLVSSLVEEGWAAGAPPGMPPAICCLTSSGLLFAKFIDIRIISGVIMLSIMSSYASSIAPPPGLLANACLAIALLLFSMLIWSLSWSSVMFSMLRMPWPMAWSKPALAP